MKALVFGTTGQVAQALAQTCPAGVQMVALSRAQADLSDPVACVAAIAAHPCDVIINAAAYTAVDRAEEEEALATVINGAAPAAMARAAAAAGIPFLHVSTDYVFDGTGEAPWRPEHATDPLNAYGRSKLVGEQGIQAAAGPHAILRTSWVFSETGANFVKTMLRLSDTRDALSVVNDQIGGPTAADDIAVALWSMAAQCHTGRAPSGIYHFAGAHDTTWECFARETFAQAGRDVTVTGIPASEYPTLAKRPMNSRMDCTSLEADFGITRPDWRASLGRVITALNGIES